MMQQWMFETSNKLYGNHTHWFWIFSLVLWSFHPQKISILLPVLWDWLFVGWTRDSPIFMDPYGIFMAMAIFPNWWLYSCDSWGPFLPGVSRSVALGALHVENDPTRLGVGTWKSWEKSPKYIGWWWFSLSKKESCTPWGSDSFRKSLLKHWQ